MSPVEQVQQLYMLAEYQKQQKKQIADLNKDIRPSAKQSIAFLLSNPDKHVTEGRKMEIKDNSVDAGLEIVNIVCPVFTLAKQILDKYLSTIPAEYFDAKGDRCYCRKCHHKRGDSETYYRGMIGNRMKYGIPVGWSRFGLAVDAAATMNNVFEDWHVSFHGTHYETVPKIFAARLLLLKPGDITLGGNELNVRGGHIKKPFERMNRYSKQKETFNPSQIFTSPSIKYASNDVYSTIFMCKHPSLSSKKWLNVKFAFQCRQRPGSYTIAQETIRATERGIIIDGHFSNDELEWYTQENVSICLHGLMIKVDEV